MDGIPLKRHNGTSQLLLTHVDKTPTQYLKKQTTLNVLLTPERSSCAALCRESRGQTFSKCSGTRAVQRLLLEAWLARSLMCDYSRETLVFHWLLLEDLLLAGDSILDWLTFTREGLTLQSMSTKASCYLIELHGGHMLPSIQNNQSFLKFSELLKSHRDRKINKAHPLKPACLQVNQKRSHSENLNCTQDADPDYWRVSKRAFGRLGPTIWGRFIAWMTSILYHLQNGYTLTYWRMKHGGQVSHGWLLLRLSITRKTVASHWFGNEPSRSNLKIYIYLYTHDLECSRAKPQSDHTFVSKFNTTVCQWELLIVCCTPLFGQLNDMGNRKDRWACQVPPLSWFTTNGKW